MRSVVILALTALALAAPHPQSIEFDLVDLADAPEIMAPIYGTNDIVIVEPPDAVSTVGAAAPTSMARRRGVDGDLLKRDGNCSPQPAGTGPAVSPDTPEAFLTFSTFLNTANNAPTPPGYSSAFTNLTGSSQTTCYLGYTTLDSYNTVACASYCDQLSACQAFNIFYERDPTLDPNADSCPNPPSLTNIKCVRWGVDIQAETATNYGQWRDSFNVVITGSNGYNKKAPPPSISGFSGPVELGGAMQAPRDPVTNQNTYMGYKFFAFGTGTNQVQYYNPLVCTAACTAQTNYNLRHPPQTGNPNKCNQVIAYVLSDDAVPQGMYCAMYTEAWAPEYATNYGQYRGANFWSVSQSYAYTSNAYAAQYAPICDIGGCPGGSYSGGNCGGWGPGTC